MVNGARDFEEPGVFVSFEETPRELTENVRSLGFDIDTLEEQGKLILNHFDLVSEEIILTGSFDLGGLFMRLKVAFEKIGAKRVVLDTIEALFVHLPDTATVRTELQRLFRWLKDQGVTAIITGERGESSLTRFGLEEYVSDCVIALDHRVLKQISTRRLRVVSNTGGPPTATTNTPS